MVEGIVRLYSSNPLRDRYEIHKKTILSKERSVLEKFPDNSPLRKAYIEGHDRKIYDIIFDFFNSVDLILWIPASKESRITTTVGILAMFDILKEILMTQGPEVGKFDPYISLLESIDFSNQIFKTSGAARSQIKNLFRYKFYLYLQSNGSLPKSQEKELAKLASKYRDEFSAFI